MDPKLETTDGVLEWADELATAEYSTCPHLFDAEGIRRDARPTAARLAAGQRVLKAIESIPSTAPISQFYYAVCAALREGKETP